MNDSKLKTALYYVITLAIGIVVGVYGIPSQINIEYEGFGDLPPTHTFTHNFLGEDILEIKGSFRLF